MQIYHMTVYTQKGEKLVDDTFEAQSDEQAKEIGLAKLKEENYTEHTYRVVSPLGKLVLFHS